MYNKLISFVILSLIIWGVFFFFYYFFVLNKWNITLISNVGDYTVEMYTDRLKATLATQCQNKKCELIDLAPFDYQLTIKKEWYKDFQTFVKVETNDTIDLEVSLEKQLKMVKQEEKQTPLNDDKEKQIEKFRTISFLQKTYQYFDIKDFWYFYFEKNTDNTLSFFYKTNIEDKKIYTLNFISDEEKIFLDQVYAWNNEIYFSYGEYIYIFDIVSWNMQKIFFPQKISYLKKDGNIYHFVNEKWTFLYDNSSQKTQYFYLFKDFITFDNTTYFWIIFQDEEEKKKNYNLSEYKNVHLIVKYDFSTKEIKVLETTTKNISKIIKSEKDIFFYDTLWEKYKVENIQ